MQCGGRRGLGLLCQACGARGVAEGAAGGARDQPLQLLQLAGQLASSSVNGNYSVAVLRKKQNHFLLT